MHVAKILKSYTFAAFFLLQMLEFLSVFEAETLTILRLKAKSQIQIIGTVVSS